MNYFTPELMEQLGSPTLAVARAADQEWDRRLEQYEEHLRRLGPELPEHIREFNGLLLHDVRVHEIARNGEQLLIVLRKDVPPRDLILLTYTLAAEPFIDREALPALERSPAMAFLYDEFDVQCEEDNVSYTQNILFSNGWELRLRFRDVQYKVAEVLYPLASRLPLPAIRLRHEPEEGVR